ncbi:MAG TPA: hypothetical protein VFV78_15130 [Vicinamibacterales bacterium]|nr:hypothetical protein [Vicinamibacterales bacterium]
MRATTATRWALTGAFAALIVSAGGAHSVPTHKNITTAAVAWLLEAQPRLQCPPGGKTDLTNALLVGTEHEDDYYDNADPLKMGRFQFHFRPRLDDEIAVLNITVPGITGSPVVLATLDLGEFKSNRCTSREWGGFATNAAGNVTCDYEALGKTYTMTNVNTWGNALADAQKPNTRYNGVSEGFVKLGYLVHLVEDQSSPAHARNAAHGHTPVMLDVLKALDPSLKGQQVDLGFPDAMEAAPNGNDAIRDIPRGSWPARNPALLMDAAPADILDAMHNVVVTKNYTRESMHERTARMVAKVKARVEAVVESMARDLKLPWPLGKETVSAEFQELKRRVAQAVVKELQAEAAAELAALRSRSGEADTEWAALGPEAVRLSASLIWKYITQANPVLGACTLKP